jgi:hypothetical protein
VDALIGFLGAALGAALGAWATLYVDRKQRQESQRYRYSPEYRALFMDYLGMADARVLAVREQAEAAWEWSQGRIDEKDIPHLGTTDALESKLHEVQDAMPQGSIAKQAARLLFLDVTFLDVRAHRPSLKPFDPAVNNAWKQSWASYEDSRDLVRRTYQVEVGA